MTPIRAIIVDDEPPARRRIRRLLADRPAYEVVEECASGAAAVEAVRRHRPQLLFLDVQMPGLDGFGVLSALGPGVVPAVVFVTAYDEYAVAAFEAHALDYLLKPFDDERFEEALRRAELRLRERRAGALRAKLLALLETTSDASRSEPPFAVRKHDRILLVEVDEVDWIEAAGDYVRLHTGDASHLVRSTLHEVEDRLDPERFLRVHRSAIVRADRIRDLRPRSHGDYTLVLRDGTEVRMSRTYRERVRAALDLPL